MRKNYLLLPALLIAFSPAYAAFEVEREPVPTYFPHAAVSPVATPASVQPYPAVTGSAAPLQMTPATGQGPVQHSTAVVDQPATTEIQRLISEDAKRAMAPTQNLVETNTQNAITKNDPRLGKLDGIHMGSFSSNFSLHEETTAVAQVTEVAVTVAKPVDVTPIKRETPWVVESGSFMRDTLTKWAHKAGWSIVWNMPENEDLRVDSANAYGGDFSEAVRSLFDSLPPHIQIFAKQVPDNVPPLLYVTREPGAR